MCQGKRNSCILSTLTVNMLHRAFTCPGWWKLVRGSSNYQLHPTTLNNNINNRTLKLRKSCVGRSCVWSVLQIQHKSRDEIVPLVTVRRCSWRSAWCYQNHMAPRESWPPLAPSWGSYTPGLGTTYLHTCKDSSIRGFSFITHQQSVTLYTQSII